MRSRVLALVVAGSAVFASSAQASGLHRCGTVPRVPHAHVNASAETSCAFARNVAQDWITAVVAGGRKNRDVRAYSPSLGRRLTVWCQFSSTGRVALRCQSEPGEGSAYLTVTGVRS